MDHRTGILLVVVLMAITAGCLDMESQVSVNQDGELEQMEVNIVFHDATWGTLESFAQSEGYDSVEEYLKAEGENDSSQPDEDAESEEGYDCNSEDEEVTVDEEEQSMTYSCSNPSITNQSLVSVETSDGGDTVTYRDKTLIGEFEGSSGDDDFNFGQQPEATHTVVMPGEITDSNAHEVDGQKATWNLTRFDGEELYAESGTEQGLPASDGDGPGFTIVAGIVAILAVAVIAHRRR